MNNKLQLPDVTLYCLDTMNHELALHAIMHSMGLVDFGKVIWATDSAPLDLPQIKDIHIEEVPPVTDISDYSKRIVKDLLPLIKTSHVLVMQWDGYVANPKAWNPEFLEYDYIGAIWDWHPPGQRVGNGGFSLRSKKLLNALRSKEFEMDNTKNEDEWICHVWAKQLKKKYNIKIAPENVAQTFSFECKFEGYTTFGFHAVYNFPFVMSEKKLCALIPYISKRTLMGGPFKLLVQNCIQFRLWNAVREIAFRILKLEPGNPSAFQLLDYARKNDGSIQQVTS